MFTVIWKIFLSLVSETINLLTTQEHRKQQKKLVIYQKPVWKIWHEKKFFFFQDERRISSHLAIGEGRGVQNKSMSGMDNFNEDAISHIVF